jgi:5-formyltetrahydrofolate cyclo-ligase
MIPPLPIANFKQAFREKAKRLRAEAAKMQPDAARFAAGHLMTKLEPKPGLKVAIYHAKDDELATAPLAQALAEAGAAVLLPRVVRKRAPLEFRLFSVDEPLSEGAYGIMEPGPDAEVMTPDIIVTPLLAVRPDGARLGMGGGYYDRTLAALREEQSVLAIGFGYANQQMDRFPVGPEDQFLDGFVSERGYTAFDRRR